MVRCFAPEDNICSSFFLFRDELLSVALSRFTQIVVSRFSTKSSASVSILLSYSSASFNLLYGSFFALFILRYVFFFIFSLSLSLCDVLPIDSLSPCYRDPFRLRIEKFNRIARWYNENSKYLSCLNYNGNSSIRNTIVSIIYSYI